MQQTLTPDSPVAQIVLNHPDVIPVLDRFGITLGLGNATITDVCTLRHIDPCLLLTVLNTFVNPDYFPEQQLKSVPLPEIIHYLQATDQYYRDRQLPNVRRHFAIMTQRSQGDTAANLHKLLTFFEQSAARLTQRIDRDNRELYPLALGTPSDLAQAYALTARMAETDTLIADRFYDLISLIVMHLHGDYDSNLCHAVINALLTLHNDLRRTARLRDRILRPMLENAAR